MHYSRAFSLAEISVVLLIVGLLAGGIVAGNNMIHSAKIRSMIKEANQYKATVTHFEEQYNALPGDMDDAESYWSVTSPCTPGFTGACNGDGDGFVRHGGGRETAKLWSHLRAAGLTPNDPVDDWSFAETPFPPATYLIQYINMHWVTGNIGHGIVIGTPAPSASGNMQGVFSTEDTYSIDLKLDDGMPKTGLIVGAGSHGSAGLPGCVNGTNNYDLQTDGAVCVIFYFFDFM